MKSLLIVAFLAICFCSHAQQQPDTTHYYYDTAYRTEIWFVNNIYTGGSTTGFALRVTKSKLLFVPPTQAELKQDSFTVKKQKVAVAVTYYLPVQEVDSAASKGKKKLVYKTVYEVYPSDLILNDFNKNWDYMLPKSTKADSLKKEEVNAIAKKHK